MKDFTISKYRELLEALLEAGYKFLTMEESLQSAVSSQQSAVSNIPPSSNGWGRGEIILRHDVDLKPENSLLTAQLEHTLGIRATYYFRIVPESNQPKIIEQIAALGHEIGYHYEDLTLASGDIEKAYALFKAHLEYFRQFYPIRTICMHGSPRSPFDSKDIWKTYDYHTLGIIAEPYLDTDFSRCFYLTDTGRCWDGYRVSVRDKIPRYQDEWTNAGLTFHSTDDIIGAVASGKLPQRIMITTHPQRWTDNKRAWWREMINQNIKNIAKRILLFCR